jgi:hypothetical protein
MNFNATSVSARWKAEIQSSRRTEAPAVASVIPINFRFHKRRKGGSTLRGASNQMECEC